MNRINADSDTLMRQAPATASFYLREAIEAVEVEFGKGTASQHPAIIAALINASAIDFGSAIVAGALEMIADRTS